MSEHDEGAAATVEDPHIRPFAEVTLPSGNYFVLESPREVTDKLSTLVGDSEDRMGLGVGSGEAFADRLLQLTGIDVWISRDGSIDIDLFELYAPVVPSFVRGLSEKWWANFLKERRSSPPGGIPGIPGFEVVTIGDLLGRGRSIPLRTDEFEENRERSCCCGHMAAGHVVAAGEAFVGECSDPNCNCGKFHTHAEPA